MQPQGENEYKQLLTDVIKKQIVILGPDITLVKARNVPGLTVSDDGTVTAISGEPQQITQNLIDQFVQLSGLIVKKTMEPLLSYHPDGVAAIPTPVPAPVIPPVQTMPAPPMMPSTATISTSSIPAPTNPTPATGPTAMPMPTTPSMPVATDKPAADPQHTDQIDAETQKIIDEALKQSS